MAKRKIEGKFAIAEKKKNEIRDFYLLGSYPLVGRHVVNDSKIVYNVGCHVENELKAGYYVTDKLGIF